MLKLPDVTLFAIDCFSPGRTLLAMRYTCRWIEFGHVILLTDTRKHPNPPHRFEGLTLAHIEESDRKEAPFPGHAKIAVDYDRDILTQTAGYCTGSHLLHMEWDSAALNPMAWDPNWLRWDFIGAPWTPHQDPGWPPCVATNCVGNFGFCLGSRQWWNCCAEAVRMFKDNPVMAAQMMSSDRFMCRTMRPFLESQRGIRFAPWDVAYRFSCENRIYAGEFGAHGKGTFALNNWSTKMFNDIKQSELQAVI